MASYFSNWAKWTERNSLSGIGYPGVQALAYSRIDISNTRFTYRPEIIYFGMTNSRKGLTSRLQQFQGSRPCLTLV